MPGDEIMVSYGPDQEALARVVAIGIDLVVDDIDRSFYDWSKKNDLIDKDSVVVEWLDPNPIATQTDHHNAPIGNYLTLDSLCCETFVRRRQE